jgi:hypothetical protein
VRDISRVYFYDPELTQYFEIPYRDRSRPAMSLWELRAAQQSLREQGRQHTDRDAVFDSIERLRQKQEEAAERTPARPARGATAAIERRRGSTGARDLVCLGRRIHRPAARALRRYRRPV